MKLASTPKWAHKADLEASDAICNILRRTGIKSLHEVDRGVLTRELSPKWDLADSLPEGQGDSFVKDCLLRAREKGIGLNHFEEYLKAHHLEVDKHTAHRVLVSVEERLRFSMEEKYGHRQSEIRLAILEATGQILKDPSNLKQVISSFSDDESRSLQSTKFFQENEQIIAVPKEKTQSLER